MGQLVGSNVFRVDGPAKVTGRALYVDDLKVPGVLWGMTLRSKVARGRLKSITYDPNYDWTGIVRVDHRDIPGKNVIALIRDDQPALASDQIRHMYEPIVLLACEDAERLEEASGHVWIEVEALPAALSIEDAKARVAQVYGDDNLLSRLDITKGDVDAGMAQAELIVEGEYRVGWQEQMYIETNGILATPREDGGVVVCGSLQCPYYIHKALQVLLGVGGEKVQVIQAVTGGGFGGKEDYPSVIAAHAALLARKAGRPVKIIYDRGEDVASTTKRHPAVFRHKTGLMRDGTLVAMDIEADFDGGAYTTLSQVVLSRGLIHATGAYKVPHVRIKGRMYATNTPPNGAFRGFGAPQSIFAAEQHVEKLAAAVGMGPVEFRRHNLLREGDTTCTDQVLKESVGGEACLDRVLEGSKFGALRAQAQAFNERATASGGSKRRGVGLSVFFHGGGFTGNGEARLKGRVDVSLSEDGGATIYTGSTDIGQGTLTIFPQIAAQELGLPFERVTMAPPDTDLVPDSGPTVASRTCMVVGRVVQQAAHALAEAMAHALEEKENKTGGLGAAEQRGVSALQSQHTEKRSAPRDEAGLGGAAPQKKITYDPAQAAFVRDQQTVATWDEAVAQLRATDAWPLRTSRVYEPPPDLRWDELAYRGDAYPVFSWAADVAHVELDVDTYEIKVLEFFTAEDVGKAIHPRLVEGQIEGGTLQGIGYGMMEELVMKDGAVLNPRMTNYIIPTSLDAPEIRTYLVEVPFSGGPYGAKGVGELPLDGAAPAVAAAIEMAAGVRVTEAPFTPEKLFRAWVR